MISIIIIIFDIILDFIISNNMKLYDSIKILPNFNFTFVENKGIAFSMLNNNVLLIIIISIIFLYLLYRFILKDCKNKIITYLLYGGILSNLIDRIFRGYVIDYFDIKIFGYDFPIFNIADICIVIGAILLFIEVLKEQE